MTAENKYLVAINANIKIGPARLRKLLSYFGSFEKAWSGTYLEYKRAGLDDKTIESVLDNRENINPEKEWKKLQSEGIDVISINDKKYPKSLKEAYNPPIILYVKGELKKQDELAIAVVGTRRLSGYGRLITPRIVSELSRNKITIISGLALGIDTLAHKAAIENNGRTIAVLAGGIDSRTIYPSFNRKLADEIVNKKLGAVISEQHIGTPPLREFFPARNRIVAGLSSGTLVIEAPEDSGALITAKLALDANREVYAVPGSILNPQSIGPNNLIKMGAKAVTSAEDILSELDISEFSISEKDFAVLPETKEEKIIYQILENEPIHVDKIIKKAKLNTSAVSSNLTMMEIKGMVKSLGNGFFAKS